MALRVVLASYLLTVILSEGSTRPVAPPVPASYIADLFQCVRNKNPLECYGVEADLVRSIGGRVVSQTSASPFVTRYNDSLTNDTAAVRVVFNISSALVVGTSGNSSAVVSARLRVYRSPLSDEQVQSARSRGCNTSLVTLQLFAEGGNLQVNASLTRDDLRKGQWVTFENLAPLYWRWMKGTYAGGSGHFRSVSIVAAGGCDARALGFLPTQSTEADTNTPLLVTFMHSSDQAVGTAFGRGVELPVIARVQTRDAAPAADNSPCQLRSYQASSSNIGNNLYPDKFDFNFCAGKCQYPDQASQLYSNNHAQLQYFLNNKYPNQVPSPCCVPKDLRSVSFFEINNDSPGIRTIVNLSASSCECR